MSTPKLVTTATASNPNVHDIELDDSGQPVWLDGDVTSETYAQWVAQKLKCRWLMMKNEWYLDQRLGVPWTQTLFRKGVTVELIKRVFTDVALGTPGIISVDSVSVAIDKTLRQATIEYILVGDNNTLITTEQLDTPFIVDIPEVRRNG